MVVISVLMLCYAIVILTGYLFYTSDGGLMDNTDIVFAYVATVSSVFSFMYLILYVACQYA